MVPTRSRAPGGGGGGGGGMQRRGLSGSMGSVDVVVDEELGTVEIQPQQTQQQQTSQPSPLHNTPQRSGSLQNFVMVEEEKTIKERELFGWGEERGEGVGGEGEEKIFPTVAFLEEWGGLFFIDLLTGRMREGGEGVRGERRGELNQFCQLLGGGGGKGKGVMKVFGVDEKGREEGELSMGQEEVEGLWDWERKRKGDWGEGEEGGEWWEVMTKKRGGCHYLVVGGGKGVGVLCLKNLRIGAFVSFSSLLSSTPPSLGPRLGPGVGGGGGGGGGGGRGEGELVHFSLVSKGGEQVCVCVFGGGGGVVGDVVVLSLMRLEMLYMFQGAAGRMIRLPGKWLGFFFCYF